MGYRNCVQQCSTNHINIKKNGQPKMKGLRYHMSIILFFVYAQCLSMNTSHEQLQIESSDGVLRNNPKVPSDSLKFSNLFELLIFLTQYTFPPYLLNVFLSPNYLHHRNIVQIIFSYPHVFGWGVSRIL